MLLTETEIKDITKSVQQVLAYSEDVNIDELAYVPEIIDQWYKEKRDLADRYLDGQVIKEFGEIKVELTQEEKCERVVRFAETLIENDIIPNSCCDWRRIMAMQHFIEKQQNWFFSNIVKEDYTYSCGTFDVHIPAGIKIIKAFKYFIEDSKILRRVQDLASTVIQENCIKGILCASVHPLDFLSLSENNYNWRSCHSLDGEYRSGNLSYILDRSTIICYLKGQEKVRLPRFPSSVRWNDKKWRMLINFSENKELVFASRQYPFFSRNLLDAIRGVFQHTGQFTGWDNAHLNAYHDEETNNQYYLKDTYLIVNANLFPKHYLIRDARGSCQFNDLIDSTVYQPYYCYDDRGEEGCSYSNENYASKISFADMPGYQVIVGNVTPCICCGEELPPEEGFICADCLYKIHMSEEDRICNCAKCGRKMYRSESVTVHWLSPSTRHTNLAFESVCPECYDKDFAWCPSCGQHWRLESFLEDSDLCPICRELPEPYPTDEFIF